MATPVKPTDAQLEKPAGTPAPKAEETVIHVIPEEFYGAALKKKVPKKMPEQAPIVPQQAPPPAQPPGKVPQPTKKKGGKGIIIVVVLLVVLGGGGAAAYFLLMPKTEPGPAAPVCGNAQCERPNESSATCPEDCGPPPPVCGDAKCERPNESSATCPEDCGPPPPVCGDAKCDEGETPASCAADCKPEAVCGNGQCEDDEDYKGCPADCEAPEPVSGNDSESDGLTDVEERTIYGSDPNLSNTDGDDFVDLNEVLNLYDPAKPTPAKLADSVGITTYSDGIEGWSILRPSSWSVRQGGEGEGTRFVAPTGEFVQVLVDDIGDDKTLDEWYAELAPDVDIKTVSRLTTKQGYEEIISPNRMTAFVRADGKVFIFSYDLAARLEIQYRVTFEMMVNSFLLKE